MNTTHDLEKLVFDFNIDIGVNRLGGVVGCYKFFTDVSILSKEFDQLVDLYSNVALIYDSDPSLYEKELASLRQKTTTRFGEKKSDILMCYLGFMTQIIMGLNDCPEFAIWIINSKFTSQPEIFTHQVLVKCLQRSIKLGNNAVASLIASPESFAAAEKARKDRIVRKAIAMMTADEHAKNRNRIIDQSCCAVSASKPQPNYSGLIIAGFIILLIVLSIVRLSQS